MSRARKNPVPSGVRSANSREVCALLRHPPHDRGAPRSVRVVETHFAWVFLVGRKAYKLKKALRQTSLDYRSLAARERGCRNEVSLNRRLAPRIYLRSVPIVRTQAGELILGGRAASLARRGTATILDWLIEMVRLPARGMLDRAITEGRARRSDLERLAERLDHFFRRARPRPMGDRAYRARLRGEIRQNGRQLGASALGLSRRRIEPVIRAQLEFVTAHAEALAGRGGRLLDGHGDLRPEHVYLGGRASEVCVIDCLEFDPNLRRLDPAEEVAFLALECERLGARAIAWELIDRYRAATSDPVPEGLMHFYMSCRAATRSKIAAWRLREVRSVSERRKWKARAYSYLDDALEHIRAATRAFGQDRAGRLLRGAVAQESARSSVTRNRSCSARSGLLAIRRYRSGCRDLTASEVSPLTRIDLSCAP
jgi:uncharacterized protein